MGPSHCPSGEGDKLGFICGEQHRASCRARRTLWDTLTATTATPVLQPRVCLGWGVAGQVPSASIRSEGESASLCRGSLVGLCCRLWFSSSARLVLVFAHCSIITDIAEGFPSWSSFVFCFYNFRTSSLPLLSSLSPSSPPVLKKLKQGVGGELLSKQLLGHVIVQ